MAILERGLSFSSQLDDNEYAKTDTYEEKSVASLGFDPDMLYVECQKCGKAIIWSKGKTSHLLVASGINLSYLGWDCLILSDGCATCSPTRQEGFTLSVVKVAGVTPEEAEYLSHPYGNA